MWTCGRVRGGIFNELSHGFKPFFDLMDNQRGVLVYPHVFFTCSLFRWLAFTQRAAKCSNTTTHLKLANIMLLSCTRWRRDFTCCSVTSRFLAYYFNFCVDSENLEFQLIVQTLKAFTCSVLSAAAERQTCLLSASSQAASP